jgi:hypothetical protein
VDADADAVGVGIVAGTAAAFTAHGILKSIQRRRAEIKEKEPSGSESTEE